MNSIVSAGFERVKFLPTVGLMNALDDDLDRKRPRKNRRFCDRGKGPAKRCLCIERGISKAHFQIRKPDKEGHMSFLGGAIALGAVRARLQSADIKGELTWWKLSRVLLQAILKTRPRLAHRDEIG
ncbi:hypothetical protein [uncultured Roseobacter sp.]|uniref:hypothetical protein n=1 Tax=uncultured Roseobacter sp. TaxID=114847 RepID=UPI00263039FB|nr:hypothetical protein [uncultured Roseobacter sp.]